MFDQIPVYVQQYLPIIIFFGIAVVFAAIILGIPLLFAENRPDQEKLSAYECGFKPFSEARSAVDIRFYLVAILFIIFDVEIMFMFPWAITLKETGVYGFWSMIIFLAALFIGFIYEWSKGALEWE